jgi:hypothetical protein
MGVEDDALGVALAVADPEPVGVLATDAATLATPFFGVPLPVRDPGGRLQDALQTGGSVRPDS